MARESPAGIYYIDAMVAILLIIAGIFTFVIGIDFLGYLKPIPMIMMIPLAVTASAWLIIVLGLAGIIYGVKRLIDDVAKARAE